MNILTPKPINTFSTAAINIMSDTAKLLKKQFAEVNKIESQFVMYCEKTDMIVGAEYANQL